MTWIDGAILLFKMVGTLTIAFGFTVLIISLLTDGTADRRKDADGVFWPKPPKKDDP